MAIVLSFFIAIIFGHSNESGMFKKITICKNILFLRNRVQMAKNMYALYRNPVFFHAPDLMLVPCSLQTRTTQRKQIQGKS
jgi:hypothetical protein